MQKAKLVKHVQNYKNLKKIGKKTKERQNPPRRSLELQIKKYRNTTTKNTTTKKCKTKNEEKKQMNTKMKICKDTKIQK